MPDNQHAATTDEQEVRIIQPDFALKKKIGDGVDIGEIFSAERIAEAQREIDSKQADYLQWALKDVAELDQAFEHFSSAPDAAFYELDRLRKLSFTLKSQAGTFGFSLASDIAQSLHLYLRAHEKYAVERLAVVQKHIEALQAIFSKTIQGDGGVIGVELRQSLQLLIQKFS